MDRTGHSAAPAAEILLQEWTWKTPAMKRMTLAVCRLALARGIQGEFSAMDLSDHGEIQHGGTGIAGSVFRLLADAGIIAPVGVFSEGEFLQRRVRNSGGNPIGVWRLAHHGKAWALIQAHDPAPARIEQLEFAVCN